MSLLLKTGYRSEKLLSEGDLQGTMEASTPTWDGRRAREEEAWRSSLPVIAIFMLRMREACM